MKLITKEIAESTPALYSQENTEDPTVTAKFFTPWTHWTWYMIEYNPEERLAFGYVEGFEKELGYFSIDELEEIDGPFGLRIERDILFTPRPLSEVRK